MSVKAKIENVFEVSDSVTREDVQYIPAKIEANCEASVRTKFSQRISKNDEDGCLEVHLRGRPLRGNIVQLPPNFHGFIGTTKNEEGDEGKTGSKKYKIVSDFTDYTYWNWDRKPTPDDSHVKLLDWLKVSEVLHAPISPDDESP